MANSRHSLHEVEFDSSRQAHLHREATRRLVTVTAAARLWNSPIFYLCSFAIESLLNPHHSMGAVCSNIGHSYLAHGPQNLIQDRLRLHQRWPAGSVLVSPGAGTAFVVRSNGDGTFAAVYRVGDNGAAPPNGSAGYDLLSTNDEVFAFDCNGDGQQDLLLYRPVPAWFPPYVQRRRDFHGDLPGDSTVSPATS